MMQCLLWARAKMNRGRGYESTKADWISTKTNQGMRCINRHMSMPPHSAHSPALVSHYVIALCERLYTMCVGHTRWSRGQQRSLGCADPSTDRHTGRQTTRLWRNRGADRRTEGRKARHRTGAQTERIEICTLPHATRLHHIFAPEISLRPPTQRAR